MIIKPARHLNGRCRVPGDKSISHRAALIAALAKGPSRISNFSTSDDCAATIACLKSLGVAITREGTNVRVEGKGLRSFNAPSATLNCGNSGTTLRLLAGVLVAQSFSATLTGDESLARRPMKRIIDPLGRMGAQIVSHDGRAPLEIAGNPQLKPPTYELPLPSAQVKSCLLLAGLHAEGRTEITERSGLTRDHTERMLQWFGVPVEVTRAQDEVESNSCAVTGPASFSGTDVHVPGDFSSAAFLIAAAALLDGSKVEIEDVGLNPTRTKFLDIMRALGAQIDIARKRETCKEPVGSIQIGGITLREGADELSLTISGALSAALIDELPLLAVVGSQLSGGLIIRDARELRHKETDRIAATAKNLKAMSVAVEEFDDGLHVFGNAKLRGAKLESFGDHRIAMAFSVAALLAEGESELVGSECVGVSFPDFFGILESLVER